MKLLIDVATSLKPKKDDIIIFDTKHGWVCESKAVYISKVEHKLANYEKKMLELEERIQAKLDKLNVDIGQTKEDISKIAEIMEEN